MRETHLFSEAVPVAILRKIRHLFCVGQGDEQTVPDEHKLLSNSVTTSVRRHRERQCSVDSHFEVLAFSHHVAQSLLHARLQ